MNSFKSPLGWILFLLLVGMFTESCKHEIPVPVAVIPIPSPPPPPPLDDHPCDPDTVYFVNTILPFLTSNCAQPDCHDAITHEEGIRMYSYSTIMGSGIITPGDPGDSDLYDAITDNDPDNIMPPTSTGITLSNQQIQMIATWISQGALNNSCGCDATQFTYAAVIKPIMENSCQGCHSGSSPDGGLSLTNYDQVRASALSGALMAGLTGTNGVPLMPYNTGGLQQCKIDQIQAWINAGTPNN